MQRRPSSVVCVWPERSVYSRVGKEEATSLKCADQLSTASRYSLMSSVPQVHSVMCGAVARCATHNAKLLGMPQKLGRDLEGEGSIEAGVETEHEQEATCNPYL